MDLLKCTVELPKCTTDLPKCTMELHYGYTISIEASWSKKNFYFRRKFGGDAIHQQLLYESSVGARAGVHQSVHGKSIRSCEGTAFVRRIDFTLHSESVAVAENAFGNV